MLESLKLKLFTFLFILILRIENCNKKVLECLKAKTIYVNFVKMNAKVTEKLRFNGHCENLSFLDKQLLPRRKVCVRTYVGALRTLV